VSLNEGIDATTPAGKLQMHILAAMAEIEGSRIAERVKAGLQRAKAQGKRIGRPRQVVPTVRVEAAARMLCVSRSTVKRWRRAVQKTSAPGSRFRRDWPTCPRSADGVQQSSVFGTGTQHRFSIAVDAGISRFGRKPKSHSSSMTPLFGLTDGQIFEERPGRPELFPDRSVEFFRLLTQPLDAQEQALWLTRGRRRLLRWPRHGQRESNLHRVSRGV
jgi:hypothetical protein